VAETPKCVECGGKLGVKATKCRCGWVMPGAPRDAGAPPPVLIACCFANCPEGAICRMYTKTGWANVCLTHYPKLETVPLRSNAPHIAAARKAYEGSFHYQQRHDGEAPRQKDRTAIDAELAAMRTKMAEFRQPGQDDEELPLGVARDPLEAEFDEGRA